MNTAEVLDKLAAKLGVTAQYLWGVLLKQAPIAAVLDILQDIIIIGWVCILVKLTRWAWKKTEKGWDEAPTALGLTVAWVFTAVMICVVFFSFTGTITAIVNPEYWALDRLLSSMSIKK